MLSGSGLRTLMRMSRKMIATFDNGSEGWCFMLYLFDLDGTIIHSYMESVNRDYDGFSLKPGVEGRIAALRGVGDHIAIVTNQAGVAFGYVSQQQVLDKFRRVACFLDYNSIWLCDGRVPLHLGLSPDALPFFVCYNDARSPNPLYIDAARRKPSPAMLLEAVSFYYASLFETVFIGDRAEDEASARSASMRFVWADDFFGSESARGSF